MSSSAAITECSALSDWHVRPLRSQGLTHSATGPESCGVIRCFRRVRSSNPEPMASCINEVRVHLSQVIKPKIESIQRGRQEIGKEHVGCLDELQENFATFDGLYV